MAITRIAFLLILLTFLGLFLAGLSYGVAGYLLGSSIRKGQFQFRSSMLLGLSLCFISFTYTVFILSLPVSTVSGVIGQVKLHHHRNNSTTQIEIVTSAGGTLQLNAAGSGKYFHPGERILGRYRAMTGALIQATFFDSSGMTEGGYNGENWWGEFFWFSFGLLMIWSARNKFRRDPEALAAPSEEGPSLITLNLAETSLNPNPVLPVSDRETKLL